MAGCTTASGATALSRVQKTYRSVINGKCGTPARSSAPFQAAFTVEMGRSEFFGLGKMHGLWDPNALCHACKTTSV